MGGERSCRNCGVDISARYHNAKQCKCCYAKKCAARKRRDNANACYLAAKKRREREAYWKLDGGGRRENGGQALYTWLRSHADWQRDLRRLLEPPRERRLHACLGCGMVDPDRKRSWRCDDCKRALEREKHARLRARPDIRERRRARQAVRNKHRWRDGRVDPDHVALLMGRQKGRCVYCGCNIRNRFHRDHIVPFALGGPSTLGNMQLLCPTCNLSKNARDPIEFAQERGMLL